MDRVESEQKYYLEDGRLAEKHVVDDGKTRVTEIYEEIEKPKKLSQRIVEKLEPTVCERTVETVDEDGSVIESTTEVVEPQPLVAKKESSLTREDVSAMIADSISAVVDAVRNEHHGGEMVTSFNAGAIIGERLQPKKKKNILDWVLLGVIVVEVAVLGYLLWPSIQQLIQQV